MAGWDEGNVFFSDQAAAFREGDDAGLTAPVARRKFVHFLNNFRSEPSPGRADGETLYKDRLDAMRPSGGQAELHAEPVTLTITAQLEDLIAHDPELADKLKQKPAEYTALVRADGGKTRGARLTLPRAAAGDGLRGRLHVAAQRAAGRRGAAAPLHPSLPHQLADSHPHPRPLGAPRPPAAAARGQLTSARRRCT